MLIRSQDKKRIVNMDNIENITIDKKDIYAEGINALYDLGEYTTEEKAIKVLDMIQECYVGTYGIRMPQDSEV